MNKKLACVEHELMNSKEGKNESIVRKCQSAVVDVASAVTIRALCAYDV